MYATRGAAIPYLGQIATRCWIPQELDKKRKQFNSRSWHFCRDAVSSFQIAFANWYAIGGNSNPTGAERGPGSEAQVLASVEYPQGKFTRITWKGMVEATIADGETALSDPIKISIRAGERFYVRFFYRGAAVPTIGGIRNAPSDSFQAAVDGLEDLTMGGSIVSDPGGQGFTPAAIVTNTTRPSVAIIGDSIVYGNFDYFDATGDLGIIARAVGSSFGYLNLACGNDRGDQFVRSHARRAALAQYASTIFIQYGTNDLAAGQTAEQVLANRSEIASLFQGKRIIETTILPRTTSTDGWKTDNNQTVLKTEAARISVNDAVRAGRPGFDHFCDFASALETATNSGRFLTPGYTPDGVHIYKNGQLRAASSINRAWIN
jgi:hypothetical protein